jgi:hypothetical protein
MSRSSETNPVAGELAIRQPQVVPVGRAAPSRPRTSESRQDARQGCLIALKASGIIEQVTAMSSLGAASILTAGTAAQEARRNWLERLYPEQG